MKHSGPYHPRLDRESPILYLPDTGAIAAGSGIGPAWTSGAPTISHPTPTAGFTTQHPRTRFANTGVANQELGVHLAAADLCRLWRGNAASIGGFYFSAQFMVNALEGAAIRFFCGVSAYVAGGVCQTLGGQPSTFGLWCDSTEASALSLMSRAGGAETKDAMSLTLTAGILYEFNMIANANQNSVVTTLYNLGTGALLKSQNIQVEATGPAKTVFLAPQVGLSNAAFTGIGLTSLDIVRIYARPTLGLVPYA